ncbi:hypothetical protein [Niallia sp. 03190]|uniref:hypothetical protein n=1 Tax=Niallia sp. 03190 TaxID=3458061 RepID=UPI004044917B
MTQTLEKTTAVAQENNEGLVKFANPYVFEGKTYNEIDLSGIDGLTTEDVMNAEDMLAKSGTMAMVPEMNFTYLVIIASKVTGQPQEFFKYLPAKDGIKVKRKVLAFLNAGE